MPPPPPDHVSKLWSRVADLDVCHVCGEGSPDWWNAKDEIVFCDGCDIQVHMSCYGLNKLPEGDWYCTGCKEGVTKGPLVSCGTPRGICALCPHPGWRTRACGASVEIRNTMAFARSPCASRVRFALTRSTHASSKSWGISHRQHVARSVETHEIEVFGL